MQFTDSHCHLDFNELAQSLSVLLSDCAKNQINQIVVPSIGPENWQKVLSLPDEQSQIKIFKALGIHPWYLNDLDNDALDSLKALSQKHLSQVCAIGEAGIDGTIAEQQGNLNKQIAFFEAQIALANELALPIIVHHRKSHPDVSRTLKAQPAKASGIIHAFSGSYQQAKAYLDLGFKLGIGGTITYERAKKTLNTVKKLPLESLVLETDAPAMPLSGFQGQANSPLRVIDVFKTLCDIRSESAEDIANQCQQNISQVLNLRN